MKSYLPFSLGLFFVLAAAQHVSGQDIAKLQEQLLTVETGKLTYRQNLRPSDDSLLRYTVTSVDGKGREEEVHYLFSLADIDPNTVRALTKKDVILVQLLVTGKQKLVQVVSDGGEKIAYTDKLYFFAKDSENATMLGTSLKKAIPTAVEIDKNRLNLNGYNDHFNWLLGNINAIELSKKQVVQKTSGDDAVVGKLFLDQTTNAKSSTKNELSELNLALLNPNAVGYKISNDEFTITAETRRGIRGIRYTEDGKQKNYRNQIKIYAASITNGKDILKVLRKAIPLAEKAFENAMPDVSTKASALRFLNTRIAEIGGNETSLSQNLTLADQVANLRLTETRPDASTTYLYEFNFADINANNIDYDGQTDRLFVTLPIKKSVNFIKETKNGEVQNYTDNVNLYFNTIEDAIIGAKALTTLVKIYEKRMDGITYTTPSTQSAIEKLKPILKKVTLGEDTYDLFLELIDSETHTVKVTTVFSNLKKSIETVQEFSLKHLNPKNCEIVVKGKHVAVVLSTKYLEKIVKTYVDGTIKPYQNKIALEAESVEAARTIKGIVKAAIERVQ